MISWRARRIKALEHELAESRHALNAALDELEKTQASLRIANAELDWLLWQERQRRA